MNTDLYLEIYNTLVTEMRIDTDEARCIMSDLLEELENEPAGEPWDLLAEMGL